jgi:hypothetical protein
MSHQTDTEHIQSSRKPHICDWCGQRINVGEPYARWRWFINGDAGTGRAHPECREALDEAAKEEGGFYEFSPGDNERPSRITAPEASR